jgi:hypothetical protein
MSITQPAGRFAIGKPSAQAFGNGVRSAFGTGFQPRQQLLGGGEGLQQRMSVIGLRRDLTGAARGGGFKVGIVLGLPGRPKPLFVPLLFGLAGHFWHPKLRY